MLRISWEPFLPLVHCDKSFHHLPVARRDLSRRSPKAAALCNQRLRCITHFNAYEHEQSISLLNSILNNILLSSSGARDLGFSIHYIFYLLNNIWSIAIGQCLAVELTQNGRKCDFKVLGYLRAMRRTWGWIWRGSHFWYWVPINRTLNGQLTTPNLV